MNFIFTSWACVKLALYFMAWMDLGKRCCLKPYNFWQHYMLWVCIHMHFSRERVYRLYQQIFRRVPGNTSFITFITYPITYVDAQELLTYSLISYQGKGDWDIEKANPLTKVGEPIISYILLSIQSASSWDDLCSEELKSWVPLRKVTED